MEFKVIPLHEEKYNEFFIYLKDHISDNGKNNTLKFLPLSIENSNITKEIVDSFKVGQKIPVGKIGWRRVLIAVNNSKEIIGHIDLKSYNQKHTNHRAIMGMGVHRDYRRQGVGSYLIESMFTWIKANTELAQIDLWVLSQNINAIKLYFKSGFKQITEVKDIYRIDNKSYDAILMTKEL